MRNEVEKLWTTRTRLIRHDASDADAPSCARLMSSLQVDSINPPILGSESTASSTRTVNTDPEDDASLGSASMSDLRVLNISRNLCTRLPPHTTRLTLVNTAVFDRGEQPPVVLNNIVDWLTDRYQHVILQSTKHIGGTLLQQSGQAARPDEHRIVRP